MTAALHIHFLTIREHLDFRGAIVHGLGSTISFCLAVLVIWPVAALLSYHLRVSCFALGLGLSTDWIGLGGFLVVTVECDDYRTSKI